MATLFADVSLDQGDETNHRNELVCRTHRSIACGRCCMDFGILNYTRYRDDYLLEPDEEKRIALVQSNIDKYYRRRREIENAGGGGGPAASPRMSELLQKVRGSSSDVDVADLTTLVSYMCYAARSIPAARERMASLVDAALQGMPDTERARSIADLEKKIETLKAQRQADVKTKIKKKGKKGRGGKRSKEGERARKNKQLMVEMGTSMQEILLIVMKAKLSFKGDFFDDIANLSRIIEKEDSARESDPVDNLRAGMKSMGIPEEDIKIAEGTLESLKVTLKHCKDSIPIDDVSNWQPRELTDFLVGHGIDLEPVPSNATLVRISRQMVKFCVACAEVVNSMPDDDTASAIGREAVGDANDADREKIQSFYQPKRPSFMIDPQIPSDLELSSLGQIPPKIYGIPIMIGPTYEGMRAMYVARYGTNRSGSPDELGEDVYDELLQTLSVVACTHDEINANPGKDVIISVDADKDTPMEQTISLRILGVLELGKVKIPGKPGDDSIPLVVVAYWHGRNSSVTARDIQNFTGGLQRGTLFKSLLSSGEEVELLLSLFKKNAEQLKANDSTHDSFREHVKKGWRLSAFRPADPNTLGGAKNCFSCGKFAKQTCSRCGIATYCSKDCQAADWPNHKQICKKLSRKPTASKEGDQEVPGGRCVAVDATSVVGGAAPYRIFPVKIQVALEGHGPMSRMMCYDQNRQYQVFITAKNCSDFHLLDTSIRSGGIARGLKGYFKAVIQSDGKLGIFIDQPLGLLPW